MSARQNLIVAGKDGREFYVSATNADMEAACREAGYTVREDTREQQPGDPVAAAVALLTGFTPEKLDALCGKP
jgi:hypothetical protein